MKFLNSALIIFWISFNTQATEYYYQVRKNDQLGIILLSLGYKKLWSREGAVNRFKKKSNVKKSDEILQGSTLISSWCHLTGPLKFNITQISCKSTQV